MSKKILILTASIGSGHIKAAEAVAAELTRLEPEADIRTVDFMSRETSIIHYLMKRIYLLMLALVPNIYDLCYRVSSGGESGSITQTAFAAVMQPVIGRLLREYRPDIVVCTHPFPEGAADLYKRRTGEQFPLVTVMTDYSIHQIWLYPRVDRYFMATERMQRKMLRRGYGAELCSVTGIPVDGGLTALPSREALRERYGIAAGARVLMLMGGGLGLGDISATLRELERIEQPLTLIIVAGRNEKLEQTARSYAEKSHHTLMVWGYTDKARELMKTADLLITKPGALTISEAFVLGIPLLLHDPIPGPETENAVYATRRGAAVWLHPGERLAPAVRELLTDGELAGMREQAQKCARPAAARDIALEIVKFLK